MTAEVRARVGAIADEIEAEMRRLGTWSDNPPSEETVLEGGAFGLGTVAFDTWLQVVFVLRLRQVATGDFDIPSSSSVAAQAVREWDGFQDRDQLLDLIHRVEALPS